MNERIDQGRVSRETPKNRVAGKFTFRAEKRE